LTACYGKLTSGLPASLSTVVVNGTPCIVAGNNGYVVLLNAKDGKTIWSLSLPGSGYRIVTTTVINGVLVAGSKGHLYGIDLGTGAVLWKDELSGLGFGSIIFSGCGGTTDIQAAAPILQEEEVNQEAAAAAAGH